MLATIIPGSDLEPHLTALLPVSKQLCVAFPSLVCTVVTMLTKVRSAFLGEFIPGCLLRVETNRVDAMIMSVYEEIVQSCVIDSI